MEVSLDFLYEDIEAESELEAKDIARERAEEDMFRDVREGAGFDFTIHKIEEMPEKLV